MPPFGRTGPLAGLRAYGSTVEQASGLPFVNGHADWPPCQQHVAFGDPVAGLYGAAALLAGLWGRERLGGADIELCQVECLFQLCAEAIIGEQVLGRPSPRTGSRRATAPATCVAPTSGEDAWLAVAADDGAWPDLCRLVGRGDLAADPDMACADEAIEAAVGAWAAARTTTEAASALQAAGVAAAPVRPAHDLTNDPQLLATGHFASQHRRHVGEHLTPRPPFRFDGEPPPLRAPAPVLGEHTAEVTARIKGSTE